MSHDIKDGVPYINGLAAKKDEAPSKLIAMLFSDWICPVCEAHLSKESLICLNACHLSQDSRERFSALIGSIKKIHNEAQR